MMDLASFKDMMEKCSHCAFCQATCPVFKADLLETHMPRARMELAREVLLEESLPRTDKVKKILNRCLLCGHCAKTCPASIPVDEVVAAARQALYSGKRKGPFERRFLSRFMSGRGETGIWNQALSLAKTLGLAPGEIPLGNGTPATREFSGPIPSTRDTTARVAYFIGCATNSYFQDTARATVYALGRAGVEIVVPEGLVCCGMPAMAEGDLEKAKEMAAKNIALLSNLEVDALITDCTTCGHFLREKAPKLLADDQALADNALILAAKTRDVMEFLDSRGYSFDLTALEDKVTYHVPCHREWSPGLVEAPRNLLRKIPGLDFVDMDDPEACCGAGGSFFVDHKELSGAFREKKFQDIRKTKAKTLITQCPSCRSFLDREEDFEVVHPVSLLARAMGMQE